MSTPVLFVETTNGLLVRSSHDAGKLKRLRHDSRVELTPSDSKGNPLGPALSGRGRILSRDAVDPTLRALHAKYPIAGRLFSLTRMMRRRRNVIIEVTLAGAGAELVTARD
ncbi:MAG TPA: hypothetical protein VF160_04480 [Candidatus Dormibacteraeota bacterium]